MKKFLLSLAVLALGATAMNAKDYNIFSYENQADLEWTGDANGYTTTVTVDGKTFTITTAKAKSTTNLIEPGDQIRVYKNSDFTISSDDVTFNKVALKATGSNYAGEQTVSEGWSQSYADLVLTLTAETPANSVTMSATNNQYRVIDIVVSDSEGGEAAVEDGTQEHPYLIATAEDLCNAYKLTKPGEMVYFTQTADIDMAGVTDYVCFVGGDNSTYSSQITYDGQNHLIKNFAPADGSALDGLHAYCTSVFGVLNGTVKNLGVINAKIETAQGCGVIAAYAGHSTGSEANIENVFVTGTVKGTGYLGALCGTSGNDVNITNCFVNVELEGGANSAAIVGRLRNSLSLENVYAAGSVSSTAGALLVSTDKENIEVNALNVIAFNSGVADAVNSGIALEGEIAVATPETEAELITEVQGWNGFSTTKMVYGLPGLDAFAYEVFRYPTVKSVKETIALATKTNVTIGYELTVGFVNYNNVFACDAAGDFIQLYGKNTLKVGDVIPAGWSATYELYNSVTPELTSFGTLPEVTEGTFVAKEVAAADVTTDLVNSVVMVKDVVFDEATPAEQANFTGKVGDVELSFRNNYKLESVDAGTYNVTFVVTIYNNEPSLYVINYELAGTTGIDAIEAEAAAPVYHNLQGVEVANPENGIYLVRRGNKVSKEIIR